MSLGVLDGARALLATLADLPNRPVDRPGDPPIDSRGRPAAYYRIRDVPAARTPFGLEAGASIVSTGFLQIDVLSPQIYGETEAVRQARRVVALFPRLTRLGRARIERPAYHSAPLEDAPYIQVPVTVPWVARVKEGDT